MYPAAKALQVRVNFTKQLTGQAREKLPVVFVIQNNKWAISVPVEDQTAGKNADPL
jgi:2-oxoisovalerate dehydrogenase E1 component